MPHSEKVQEILQAAYKKRMYEDIVGDVKASLGLNL